MNDYNVYQPNYEQAAAPADAWVGFTFVLCAALALVAGAIMIRAARRLNRGRP